MPFVLNQTQIDSLIDAGGGAIFGANLDEFIAATIDPVVPVMRDTLQASGSLDLTRVVGLDILEINTGTASSVLSQATTFQLLSSMIVIRI